MSAGYLLLEDGTVFRGRSVAADGVAFGEAVFTTGMTGYQETVTDPSYAGQLVCFTTTMVGNYGVADDRDESAAPHAKAALMRACGGTEWAGWLRGHGLVGLEGIDTRSLVLRLRDSGSMRAAVVSDEGALSVAERSGAGARTAAHGGPGPRRRGLDARALRLRASRAQPQVAVVDYGAKRSIMRRLVRAGAAVTVCPHTTPADELATFDGVVLSNGPGDPEPLQAETEIVRDALGRVPMLGICLGHQLLGLAAGHNTYKLPFGHRGSNHPVLERRTGRVLVTSQNHGFAVEASDDAEATYVSLYDGTVEGFDFPELRARSVQFHPEAGPGPHDAWPILESWVEELRA